MAPARQELMRAILDHLAALTTKLAANAAALQMAQRRHHNMRRRSEARWNRYAEALAEGVSTREQHRLQVRAQRAQDRSQFWVGRIKELHRRIDHLEVTRESVKGELHAWRRAHGIRFVGENEVVGEGVAVWKLQKAAMLRSEHNYLNGDQPGYYSQAGAERVYSHMLYGYPWGHVYDCSTWNDGINYCCRLESPSGHEYWWGGFTGTEFAESEAVARADLLPGDFIIYLRWEGDTVGHHVERILDVEHEITLGHGTSAIGRGSRFDLFNGPYVFRRMHKRCPRLN